jgi:hypothetical protein
MGLQGLRILCVSFAAVLFLSSCVMAAERIRVLLLVEDCRIDNLRRFFDPDPSIAYKVVVTRDGRLSDSELVKLIRQYFPRNYGDFRGYDALLLAKPNYELFTPKQDRWIHDAILDGAGGINDGSVFSQIPMIPQSWSSGMAWQAFPNDAPTVVAQHGGWAPVLAYSVEINEAHPEPILTMFVPFGVEKVLSRQVSRLVVPRVGSSTLAWQVGNYPRKEPYLVAWEYGSGRAMTVGGLIPGGWLSYPTGVTGQNRYSPEILMNILYWLSDTPLIDDVEVVHMVKTDLSEFRERVMVLFSLIDFIDKFGANTDAVQDDMIALEEVYDEAAGHYIEHSFSDSQAVITSALSRLPGVESLARREKERALLWVYLIEWLVSASALFISGFVLWSLMVRRRLYSDVEATRLRQF